MEGAGAGVDGDAVAGAAEGGELALEGRHLGPQREPAALENARQRLVDLGPDRRVLRAEVHEGDFGHGAMDTGPQSSRAPNARAAKHQMTSRFRPQ